MTNEFRVPETMPQMHPFAGALPQAPDRQLHRGERRQLAAIIARNNIAAVVGSGTAANVPTPEALLRVWPTFARQS